MAVGYYGGKSGKNGQWIVSMLPSPQRGELYVETHAGMLGVLMQREQAGAEIANDLNGRIINWWLVVRDRYDELEDMLRWTPNSEQLFHEYRVSLDEGDEVLRAVKLTVILTQGFLHGDSDIITGWTRSYKSGAAIRNRRRRIESIEKLRERVIDVQFACEPAIALLDRIKKKSNAVIYLDPPYLSANTDAYAVVEHDYADTIRLLREQAGKVAISGYHDDWDELGWYRYELPYRASVHQGIVSDRVEVLWTNYKVEGVDTCTALPEPQSAPLLF